MFYYYVCADIYIMSLRHAFRFSDMLMRHYLICYALPSFRATPLLFHDDAAIFFMHHTPISSSGRRAFRRVMPLRAQALALCATLMPR